MDQVDFGHVGRDGFTIYRSCFQGYLNARFGYERPEVEWRTVVTETESVFYYLVEEGHKRGFDVDSILEILERNGNRSALKPTLYVQNQM